MIPVMLPKFYIEARERLWASTALLSAAEETLVCHEYINEEGQYRTYYIPAELDNLARFICSSANYKLVCTGMDYPVICTIGEYVDLIHAEESLKTDLFSKLAIYQNSAHRPVFKEKK